MTASPSLTLTLVDGTRVVVPDALDLITPYVLQEQEDWFEDEIKFLRRLLQPGQKVIDIGANYGAYALSMARAVGSSGRAWCFEPASGTADFLARGIAANGFGHVVLDRRALSSAPGTARLTLNTNAELNELVRGEAASGVATEEVPLTTLDACLDQYGWTDIDVLKIDAEGEEANILKGGARFFATLSPLVEFEVKAGDVLHLDLVQQFAGLGYRSYRLVPGLGLLVPIDAQEKPDGYLLNLFCCKDDRAAVLAARGLLADPAAASPDAAAELQAEASRPGYQWEQALLALPYGQVLGAHWRQAMANPRAQAETVPLARALALHALSRDPAQPALRRFLALQASLGLLKDLCAHNGGHMRLSTLARVAAEYGARALAVEALAKLTQFITRQNSLSPGEPFLAAGARFDALAPGQAIADWILTGLFEELERLCAFSSFYTGPQARQRLEIINRMGFASPEMQRRLALLRRRFG